MSFNLPIPANIVEFEKAFNSTRKCRKALYKARWPKGFRCPKCNHHRCWKRKTRPGVIECRACHFETTITAGTLFHGSKLPLFLLFKIVHLIVVNKNGISALALHRQLGINYKTALLWIRKVRTAMLRPDRDNLAGMVEIDETQIGGEAAGCQGRKLGPNQSWVIVFAEEKEQGMGRIRLVHTPKADAEWLCDSVRTEVETGSSLHTDGLQAYRPLADTGYEHEREVIGDPKQASKKFPLVHRVASLLKRWLLGTFQGSFRPWWLQSILDEFVFRFNRRSAKKRALLFARVIQYGLAKRPPTRQDFEDYAADFTGN